LTYALVRNITAVILVSTLVVQSIGFFLGVIFEEFSNQVKWDELGFRINGSLPYLYYVWSDFLWIALHTLKFIGFARKLINPIIGLHT
jgi:hypothetical protein